MIKPIRLDKNNFLSSLDISTKEFSNILDIAKSFKHKDLKNLLAETKMPAQQNLDLTRDFHAKTI